VARLPCPLFERSAFAVQAARTALAYGQIRAALERQGTPIAANNLWIASKAQAVNALLVTDNLREFRRGRPSS